MKSIFLYIGDKRIIGSDGLMHIDGRLNIQSIKEKVRSRNSNYEKHFPHKICDGFRFCDRRLNEYGKIIKL